MIAQVKDNSNLLRDMNSKGISNVDVSLKERLKKDREVVVRLVEHDKKFDKIEESLKNITKLLAELMKKNGASS